MKNRSVPGLKPRIRYCDKIFIILAAAALLMITGCTRGIHQAAETGNLKRVKSLLQEDPSIIDETDSYGMTALHWAVDKGHYRVAEWLIAEGADVNVKDKNGETPLNYTISKEYRRRMATMLMLNGAKLPGGEDEIRDALKHIAPLHQAARDDRLEAVEMFLKKFPEQVNVLDGSGRTPLYWAARAGHIDVCEVLLANGADVNATTSEGYTPLHGAVYYKEMETVERLLEKGADVNIKSNEGETPLHWAVSGGKTKLIELLIAKGADLNAKDHDGKTPVDMTDDNDIVELLRRHGAGD